MIILMGLAGSGKGTQGKLLSKNLGYKYLSTGEYLRDYLSGKRKEDMLAGKLIDDQEIITIISSFLDSLDKKNNCILDGFPRSLIQADWLLGQHRKQIFNIEAVIYIKVSEDKLIERLLKRGRPDDTEKAIKIRFAEYKKSTSPVIDYFKIHNISVLEVDGHGTIKKIQQDILSALRDKNLLNQGQ